NAYRLFPKNGLPLNSQTSVQLSIRPGYGAHIIFLYLEAFKKTATCPAAVNGPVFPVSLCVAGAA
ncbi:hypothetical protein OU790_18310, partial [Ruegeria sp. NA]